MVVVKTGRRASRATLLALSMLAGGALAQEAPSAAVPASPAAADAPDAATAAEAPAAQTRAAIRAERAATVETALPDVIVTAQRRVESAQSIPVAASVFTPAALEARGVQQTLQLAQFVPNMLAANHPGLGSANGYYIRGLGSIESNPAIDPAVGTFIDAIYLSRQTANNFSFFDVERVEVLRGPQGVLFGRNTAGGAINVVLNRPGREIAGYGEFTYGAYDRKTGRLSIDLPITAGVAVKLSGYIQDDAGYVRNTTTGQRLNDNDGAGLRAALRVDLAPGIEWNGSVAYVRADGENLLNFRCDPANPANCNGRFASTGLRTTTASYAPLVIAGEKARQGLGNRSETLLYTSNLEWGGDAARLNLITGYVELRQRFGLDFADGRAFPDVSAPVPVVRGAPLGGLTSLSDASSRQFSQEVKLSGRLFAGVVDYTTGFYYSNETNRTDIADIATGFSGAATPRLLADRVVDNSARAIAAYAEGDLSLGAGLKLTAGLRYTDERKTIRVTDNRARCAGSAAADCLNQASLFAPSGVAIPTVQTARQWTPRFAINYKPDADLLLFASATRGFRSGGWDARADTAAELLPFGAESVWSYEAGIKSEWFGRRLRANITGFWQDTRNFQTSAAIVRADNSLAFATHNIAGYRNRGVEIELAAVPIPNLNLFADLGFQAGAYRVDRNAPGVDRYGVASVASQQLQCLAQLASGQVPLSPNSAPPGSAANNAPACANGIVSAAGGIARPVRTPRFSASAGGSYDWRLPGPGIILTPTASIVYRSAYETGTANATIFTGASTAGVGGGGRSFAANPFSGNAITGSRTGAYVLVNAGVAIRTDDGNWTLAIECFNCFDKAYVDSTLANTSYLNAPRTWQLRVKRVL